MKKLLSSVFALLTALCVQAQPDLTLWINPDAYHSNHNHNGSQQYFCESSYYIFHHPDPDTIIVTAKNEGSAPLEITGVNTEAFNGAAFTVIGFSSLILMPGEMVDCQLVYQLPPTYVNGINGQISFESNDPDKSLCTIYFDIGCGASWEFSITPQMGVYGNCDEPVVYVRDGPFLVNPNMLYEDSMTFYAFDGVDTSYRIMKLSDYGVVMRKDVVAYDRFYAGLTGNGSENAFNVDTIGVTANRDMSVFGKFRVSKVIDANGGISCDGGLGVTGTTNLDGTLDVTGDASVGGTLEVDAMTTPSDIRLKKNISPISNSLAKILMLNPKTYFLKKDPESDQRQYGFLAQELETIIPELVHQNSTGMKSVNYMQIIPLLTAALQQQQETIDRLEERLLALESK